MRMRTTVDAYLRELDQELRDLPANRRREIVEEIREHIDSALEGSGGEAEIRNVLDRLGDPADIAAEARERFGVARAKPGVREVLALVLLPIGFVLWIVGWVVGAILLLTSNVWTSREKVIGLLVFPGGLLPAASLMLLPGQVCSETIRNGRTISECSGGLMPVWLAWVLLVVLVVGPIWTVFYLASRMNRRSAS